MKNKRTKFVMSGPGAHDPQASRFYFSMEDAIIDQDRFNGATYWPLRNVITYLGRMGL